MAYCYRVTIVEGIVAKDGFIDRKDAMDWAIEHMHNTNFSIEGYVNE